MAERRMFAKTIIDSDTFLDMPLSAQALYFHLSMRADDDGFVNNPKKIQRMIGASDDDCRLLIMKKYVLTFESGVIVIRHWKIHNYIQKDRYKETVYLDEKDHLALDQNNAYTECIHNVSALDTQDSIGKVSIDKNIIYNTPKQGGQTGGQKVEKIPLYHMDELNCDVTPYYIDIINYLNEAIGTKYRYQSKLTQRLINARFKEGYTVDDFKTVIDKKAKEWKGTEMEQFLRPETLFSTKFEGYLNAPIKSRSIGGTGSKTQHFENEREYSTSECNNLLKDIDDINF